MSSRPRRDNETYEQYRENLFTEEMTARHRDRRPVSRHQINKLREIHGARRVETAASKKDVESR